MTAAEELKGQGCLGKADPNEPVFVLRGQDLLAPIVVRIWAGMLTLAAKVTGARKAKAMKRKAQAALDLADRMDAWRDRKLPD